MHPSPSPSATGSSKIADDRGRSSPAEASSIATSSSYPNVVASNPYASLATNMNMQQQSYQTYWSLYGGGASLIPPASHYSQQAYSPYQAHYYSQSLQPQFMPTTAQIVDNKNSMSNINNVVGNETTSPTPEPLPKYEHWDEAIREFLQEAGLTQALRGFQCDMLVLNADWEHKKIPCALDRLIKGLTEMKEMTSTQTPEREPTADDLANQEQALDDRKSNYVQLANGEKPRSPTSVNKEISAFLARNRARNDASNRAEFLLSLVEKRKRAQELSGEGSDGNDNIPSCARTDAKIIDRDVQMKYDIAKNDDGPLRRTKTKKEINPPPTTQTNTNTRPSDRPKMSKTEEQEALPKDHPGIEERLSNIETHLAVRYVPSPPRTLLARLKFLEDHIIRLEKDYPPWAALHFNQPNRGWPPPPRSTPIIVPPHLRSSEENIPVSTSSQNVSGSTSTVALQGSKGKNVKSSLQRAVLEQLEVQQAIGEKAFNGP